MTEAIVFCLCDICNGEICLGEQYYRIELRRLCPECLKEYAQEFFAASLVVAE